MKTVEDQLDAFSKRLLESLFVAEDVFMLQDSDFKNIKNDTLYRHAIAEKNALKSSQEFYEVLAENVKDIPGARTGSKGLDYKLFTAPIGTALEVVRKEVMSKKCPEKVLVKLRKYMQDMVKLFDMDKERQKLIDHAGPRQNFEQFACPGADFSGKDLRGVSFKKASLPNANFSGANLDGVDFSNCDLRGANFTGTSIKKTKLVEANLEDVKLDLSDQKFLIGRILCLDKNVQGLVGIDIKPIERTKNHVRDNDGGLSI